MLHAEAKNLRPYQVADVTLVDAPKLLPYFRDQLMNDDKRVLIVKLILVLPRAVPGHWRDSQATDLRDHKLCRTRSFKRPILEFDLFASGPNVSPLTIPLAFSISLDRQSPSITGWNLFGGRRQWNPLEASARCRHLPSRLQSSYVVLNVTDLYLVH